MENKMMNILQNMGLLKIDSEITYYPYTKTRKSFCMSKQLYEFPKRNILGFKYCSVYYLERLQYNPERIMLTGGDKFSIEKTLSYLNIEIDKAQINDENEMLFKQLYEGHFIYEDEQNFICGGINRTTNLSEIVISKNGIVGFNKLMRDHLHFITKQLNEINNNYNFSKVFFNKIFSKNTLKCELELTFSKKLYNEKIPEILNNQKLITDNLLNAMAFIFCDTNPNDYLLDTTNETCLYTGKSNLTWIRLLRKYNKPDIILYYGTTMFNKNNRLELNYTVYNKIAHE